MSYQTRISPICAMDMDSDFVIVEYNNDTEGKTQTHTRVSGFYQTIEWRQIQWIGANERWENVCGIWWQRTDCIIDKTFWDWVFSVLILKVWYGQLWIEWIYCIILKMSWLLGESLRVWERRREVRYCLWNSLWKTSAIIRVFQSYDLEVHVQSMDISLYA